MRHRRTVAPIYRNGASPLTFAIDAFIVADDGWDNL